MASEKVEKKEKKKDKKEKKEKKSKHLEDGVTKSKSDKKEKKKSKEKSDSIVQQLQDVATSLVPAIANGDDQDDIDEEAMDLDLITKDVPFDALVPFANPLADEKQTKKLLKSVKKAAKNKTIKRGVKEVVKFLRKSTQNGPSSSNSSNPLGVVIVAADISPMDVISHIPVLCEDHNVPYIYVKSRAELGAAGNTKRATSVVMITKQRNGKAEKEAPLDEDYQDSYEDLVKLVRKAGSTVLR